MRFFVSILSFHEYGGISTKLDLRFLLQFAPTTHRIAKSIRKTSSSSRLRTSCPHLALDRSRTSKTGRPHLRAARLRPQGRVKRTSPQSHTAALLSVDLNLGTVPKLRLERYDSSLRPSSSMASMSASAAAASSPLAKMYSLILGSVPEGRTMALFPPSRPNSMTSALGRPFTHVA